MYASNCNMTKREKPIKEKKKTVFKRLKALFSKKPPKKEPTSIIRPLQSYKDEFILPHLQNPHITENKKASDVYLNSKIKNEIGNDIILEPIECKKSISNIQDKPINDKVSNKVKKQLGTTSEIGIQTIWVNDENGERKNSQHKEWITFDSLSNKNVLEVTRKLNDTKIKNKRKSINIGKEDEDIQLTCDKSQFGAFIGKEGGTMSKDSIYTVPLTNQRLNTFEKNLAQFTSPYDNGQLSTSSTSARFKQHVDCYVNNEVSHNNEDYGPPDYEELTSPTDTKNNQYTHEEFEISANSSDYSVNNSSQSNSYLDRNNISHSKEDTLKTGSIYSNSNQATVNYERNLISNSKENILQGHFGIGPNEVKYLQYKYSQLLSKYSENNIREEKECPITIRKPIFSQPNSIPTKQIYTAPRIVWSRVASQYGSDVISPCNIYANQIRENVNVHDYCNNLETYQWSEDEIEIPQSYKDIKQLESSFENSNKVINKQFPFYNNDPNIFELYNTKESEHSSLNISLQQFTDLKNNLCITLCSSTLFDAIIQNPDMPTINSSKCDIYPESANNKQSNSTIFSPNNVINTLKSNAMRNSINSQPITNKPKQPLSQGRSKQFQTSRNVTNTIITNQKNTHVNKLKNTKVNKAVPPLNGIVRVNHQSVIKKKSSTNNNLNNITKKNKQDATREKASQNTHGSFSGNISRPSSKSTRKN